MKIRTYSEMIEFNSFIDRFNYLKLDGVVGVETFGYDRYLNQVLYASDEWKRVRRDVIIRDNGCDLGILGMDLTGKIIVHHMNPITIEDIKNRNHEIFNPEYLVSVSFETHQAIHYSDANLLKIYKPVERKAGDTCLWR